MTTRPNEQTGAEVRFLRSLGGHSNAVWSGRATRADLLRGYLDGCRIRVQWDGIDAPTVTALAWQLLNRERMA